MVQPFEEKSREKNHVSEEYLMTWEMSMKKKQVIKPYMSYSNNV